MQIRDLDDWYRVSFEQIRQYVPLTAFRTHPLEKLLAQAYPGYYWDIEKLKSRIGIKAAQRLLAVTVRNIFPHSRKPIKFTL